MNVLVIGADRGLGHVLCEELAKHGHQVSAGVLKESNLGKGLFQSESISACLMDVSDEETIKKAAEEIEQRGVKLDAVVHVAGVLMQSDRENTLMSADISDLVTAFKVNAAGIIIGFRQFYPLMRKGGRYIAITSEGGSFSCKGDMFPGYGITKTAANKVVQTLRCTVNDVEILAMHPGRMNTVMGRTTAQIEPEESAGGILSILENKTVIGKDKWFIDYKGDAMPL